MSLILEVGKSYVSRIDTIFEIEMIDDSDGTLLATDGIFEFWYLENGKVLGFDEHECDLIKEYKPDSYERTT